MHTWINRHIDRKPLQLPSFLHRGKTARRLLAVHLARARRSTFVSYVSSANDEYLWDFIGSLTWQSWWLTQVVCNLLSFTVVEAWFQDLMQNSPRQNGSSWIIQRARCPYCATRRKNPLKDPFNHPSTLCDHHRLLGKQSLSRSRTASVFLAHGNPIKTKRTQNTTTW